MRDSHFCLPRPGARRDYAGDQAGWRSAQPCEATLGTAFDFEGLANVSQICRLVEVAAYYALGLGSNITRVRALGYLAQVAVTLLEKGRA